MSVDVGASIGELDVYAPSSRAFGPDNIDAADFVISELRRISGQFDLAGQRFDDPAVMLTYACSDEFADAWRSD